MTRFWISWYGGENGDCRPQYHDEPPSFPWWCSGERDEEPQFSICAVIDARDEADAWRVAKSFWPEMEHRFCNEVEPNWVPEPSRFPPKEKQVSK